MSESDKTEKTGLEKTGLIDVVKQRGLYLGISLLLLIPGIIFIFLSVTQYETHSPVRLGIDFTGGTMLELGMEKPVQQEDIPKIRDIFTAHGYSGSVIQIQEPAASVKQEKSEEATALNAVEMEAPKASSDKSSGGNKQAKPAAKAHASKAHENKAHENKEHDNKGHVKPAVKVDAHAKPDLKTETKTEAKTAAKADVKADSSVGAASKAGIASIVSIRSKQIAEADYPSINADLEKQYGVFQVLQRNSVGPTLASELFANGLMALILAYVLIVGYLTFRFQFDYAVCAIVALVHDTVTVFGLFAMLGYLFHTEVDSMFITGILTVVGFSVHDTIVVFDRLRENSKRYYSQRLPFSTIANISLNQTLARSINTSLTALLTLIALYFFGGETTKDFVLCMIFGIAIGTYSSIFVASTMLVWWRERNLVGATQTSTAAA
jgi:preprotein translocase subunit SecF